MKFGSRIGRCRAALAVLLMAPAALSAGWYYEATTTTASDQPAGNNTMVVRAWVDGDNTKIEFVDGDESGFLAAGNYIVTSDAGENTYLVNPTEQTYSSFNLGELMGTAGQMMEGMGDMFKMEVTDIASEKISEGPGESILGYGTRHLKYRTSYTMNMAIMGMKSQQNIDMTQDMWVTDAFDQRAFAVWLRPDKRMGGMFEGMDELLEAEFSKVDGIPLKAVMVQNSTSSGGGFPGMGGGKNQNSTMTITTEVSALREESVSADIFIIPAGYTETELIPEMGDLEAMMQGQQGQQQTEQPTEEKRKRPRLKDLLKGGGG